MKTNIITLIIICVISLKTSAQCYQGTSTNPEGADPNQASNVANAKNKTFLNWVNDPRNGFLSAGTYHHNPFYNTFSWYPFNPIYLPQNGAFNIGTVPWVNGQYIMTNPFNGGLPPMSMFVQALTQPSVPDRDFYWQDGWELLWMNLGKTPDGIDISQTTAGSPLNPSSAAPNNIPYFVLYNRYRGVVRIFANVWFDALNFSGRYDAISASLEIALPPNTPAGSTVNANGLLRHVNGFDIALDQPTQNLKIHAPSQGAMNMNEWMISDFQIGFDPCICKLNNAKLWFNFTAINSATIEMVSRSITIEQQFSNKDYLTKDFMNLSEYDPNTYKPGSRIYQEMGDMLNAYEIAKQKYESDLANYNSFDAILGRAVISAAKTGISTLGGSLGEGIGNSINLTDDIKAYLTKIAPRVSKYSKGIIKLDPNNSSKYNSDLQKAAKGIISEGFDYLSSQLNLPQQPSKPTPPTASYTETGFKGSLDDITRNSTPELLVPGTIPMANNGGNPGLTNQNYPAYNEVLGLFALLETPKVEVKTTSGHRYELSAFDQYTRLWTIHEKKTYEIRLSDYLKYRFNHAVRDFDFDKTKLYYSFRIKFKKRQVTASMEANGETYQPSIMNEGDFSSEKYSFNHNDYAVVTTPFIDVTKILNEPVSIQFNFTRTFSEYSYGNDVINTGELIDYLYQINDIESIELKLMADMYFTSQGSKEQDLNTLQTFTYQVYQNRGYDNQMPMEESNTIGNVTFLGTNQELLKHQSGTVVFDNIQISPPTLVQYPYSSINGNEIHIWVENAELKNNITVDPGYVAYIHFLGTLNMDPEGEISPEIILDNIASETLYNYPLVYEAKDAQLNTFCDKNNNKYKANIGITKKESLSKSNINEFIQPLQINVHPNPANTLIQVSLTEANSGVMELYDLLGKLVMTKSLTNQSSLSIDSSVLQNGIYVLSVNTDKGSNSQKIIIQH
jgi:hypothetical protein